MPRYWEDYNVGDKFISPERTVTDAMIVIPTAIAGYTQAFFWSEEAAKKTPFGTRIGPGPLTLLFMGGLEEQTGMWDDKTAIALVGIDKVRVRAPLRAGDTIHVELEITEKRETGKPDRGVIIHRSVCKNQKGEVIAEMELAHLVKRRPQT